MTAIMDLAEALAIYKISTTSTEEDIQKRYKILIKKYHPDKNHKHSDWCHQRMTDITEAMDIILENLPLQSSFGWESHYQKLKEEDILWNDPEEQQSPPEDKGPVIEEITTIIMESMITYYQYGLENKEIRREGPRRFRFRSIQRKLQNLEKEISQWMIQPEYSGSRSILKVYYFYVQNFREYMLDPLPKQDLDGPDYIRRAFIAVRDAAKNCEDIIKEYFLKKRYMGHHQRSKLHNALHVVVVISHTYKHGRWFDKTSRFITWAESFLALTEILEG